MRESERVSERESGQEKERVWMKGGEKEGERVSKVGKKRRRGFEGVSGEGEKNCEWKKPDEIRLREP